MRKVLLSTVILAVAAASAFADNIVGAKLTSAEASGLTQDQCATLLGPQNIPVAVIPALPNACVNNMGWQFTNSQLAALTNGQISSLSFDWLRGVGQAKQTILLPNASSDAVYRILSLGMLAPNQVTSLTPDQLQGLSASQFSTLRSTYLKALTQTQMNALRADQISAVFDKWTDQQMIHLMPDQIRGLPASQTYGLVSYFASWTNDQVQALTSAQLAAVPQVFGYPWFQKVFPKLLDSQIDSITDEAIIQLAKSGNGVHALPVSKIASLKDETVVQMARAGILKNLSNDQLATLSVSSVRRLTTLKLLGGLSQEQKDALPSTNVALTAVFDASCPYAGMTLGNLIAYYSMQATKPAKYQTEGFTAVGVNGSGQFAVPYNATYVYFDRRDMPTNINFYGVDETLFSVSEGSRYTVTCRTHQ